MRVALALLVVLVAAASAEKVKEHEDKIFINQCCVEQSIPFGALACTEEFCASPAVSPIVDEYRHVRLGKDSAEKLTQDHRRGEAFGATRWFQRMIESEMLVAGVGAEDVVTVAVADASALQRVDTSAELDAQLALMEKSGRVHALKKARHSKLHSRVPFDTNVKWPRGEVRYKLDATVSGSSEEAKKTLKQFSDAIAKYHEHTCIRWIHDTHGTVTFKQNDYGSFTNDIGSGTTEINLSTGSTDIATALHEMGHCVGLEHTHVRADRDEFIDYSAEACRADFLSKECADPDTDSPDHDRICRARTGRRQLISTLRLPEDYDPANEEHLTQCKSELCLYGWLAQYQLSASPVHENYDFGSIMHYYFDGCIQAKAEKLEQAELKKPQENGLTPTDIKVLNHGYECREVKLKQGEDEAVSLWVHPQVPFSTFKAYVAERLALASVDDKLVKYGATELRAASTLASLNIESGSEILILPRA